MRGFVSAKCFLDHAVLNSIGQRLTEVTWV